MKTTIKKKQEEIEKKNEEINNSIQYAKRIQSATMNFDQDLPFAEYFALFKPRDVVSGDFYWYRKFLNYSVIAVADEQSCCSCRRLLFLFDELFLAGLLVCPQNLSTYCLFVLFCR